MAVRREYYRKWYNAADGGPDNQFIYVPRPYVVGVFVVVRGGGGGGASGQKDSNNLHGLPGPGGGGGGCSQMAGIIPRDEIPDEIPVQAGRGGAGGVSPTASTTGEWTVGENGGDSYFGDLLFAGGGGGGGRRPLSDGTYVKDLTAPGAPGYGMSRGGRGLTYLDRPRRIGGSWLFPRNARISEADAFNELHMAAGGGGGGHGYGFTQRQSSDGDWIWTDYPWRKGGDSNAMKNTGGSGSAGTWDTVHWHHLNTGCGGNGFEYSGGVGGRGGFPSGGGAGGAGSGSNTAASTGGAGRPGSVAIIELLEFQ